MLISLASLFLPFLGFSQDTTSIISGMVRSSDNQALVKATVKAIHVPSGSVYTTTTQADGRYTISNMRAGGPYTLEISYIGYHNGVYKDLSLELGAPLNLDVVLEPDSKTLSEVTIIAQRNALISSERTGAATQISRQQLGNASYY